MTGRRVARRRQGGDRRRAPPLWATAASLIVMLVIATAAAADAVERHTWSGDAAFTSKPFHAGGALQVTLAAWCHEGVSSVTVRIVDASGDAVGDVVVRGQGMYSDTFELPVGSYRVEVSSPTMSAYYWEVLVEAPAAEAEGGDDTAAVAAGGAVRKERVELPHGWSGGDEVSTEAFDGAGALEVTLGAYCHEGISFVQVVLYDRDGTAVGEVTVRGEGVASVVLDLAAGTYMAHVTSPTMGDYTWELIVRPAERAAPGG